MHMLDILLDVCGFSTLRLKSPVIMIKLISVSRVRGIESSIVERYRASALGGL